MMFAPGRALPLLAILLCASSLNAQPDLWEHLRHAGILQIAPQDRNIMLPRSQRESVARVLKARTDVWACADDDPKGEWLGNLKYTIIPVSPAAKVFLVEAGPGCARGGQGSNGAMWVIRFEGRVPIVLADPEDDFAGFLYSIGPTPHKGYRDIILGWHMSAMETGLAYFRFDGKSYRRIGSATLYSDDDAGPRIIPHHF
uniref:Lipoprotein n=1 Tax=Solibacter usitatus (strain Ellin6076) TaxID=234267 RepID=Q01T99_SOLUE